MKRKWLLALSVVFCLLGVWRCQTGPRRMAVSESPDGRARIEVIEWQRFPYEPEALFRMGEKTCRCEYYSESSGPAFSKPLSGESFYPRSASITWRKDGSAYVIIGNAYALEHRNGAWWQVPVGNLQH